MDRAGIGEMAEALATPARMENIGAVLEHATGAILNAQIVRVALSAHPLSRLLSGRVLSASADALSRERPVRPTERGGDAKTIQSLRRADRARVRRRPRGLEHREARPVVAGDRLGAADETGRGISGFAPRAAARAGRSRCFRGRCVYADLDGYAIKPHPDTRRKVLTMQIYLPADDSSASSARRSTRFRRWASSPGSPMASSRTRPCPSCRTPATRSSSSIRPIRC